MPDPIPLLPSPSRDTNDGDDEAERPSDSAAIQRLLRRKSKWSKYGNYHSCCGTCILVGPVRSWWWLLEILTILVTVTFIVEFKNYHLAVFICGVLLEATALISSWKVLFCNPGIIPKKPFPEALEQARRVSEMMRRGISYPREVMDFEGRMVSHTYCFKCQVYRPPLTTHCSICDACIVNVDHHCPVFGGCVAQKNLYWFHAMACSMAMLYPFLLISGLVAAINGIDFRVATPRDILLASIVADEVLIGIILACTLTPLLAMTPCERQRDPFSSVSEFRASQPRLPFPNTLTYPRVSREYANLVTSEYKPSGGATSAALDSVNQNPTFVSSVSSRTSTA